MAHAFSNTFETLNSRMRLASFGVTPTSAKGNSYAADSSTNSIIGFSSKRSQQLGSTNRQRLSEEPPLFTQHLKRRDNAYLVERENPYLIGDACLVQRAWRGIKAGSIGHVVEVKPHGFTGITVKLLFANGYEQEFGPIDRMLSQTQLLAAADCEGLGFAI